MSDKCKHEIEQLREANTRLVVALDLIQETLNGGEVQDLHNIINAALESYRSAQQPTDAQILGEFLWANGY